MVESILKINYLLAENEYEGKIGFLVVGAFGGKDTTIAVAFQRPRN